MKKNLLAGAIFGIWAGAAFAQSAITLYGNVSAGMGYISNVGGGARYLLDDGGFIPNLFGFIGNEDMGGGIKAIFKLESEFYIGTGKLPVQNQIFARQAYIGISSDRYGTVTFGHQTNFSFDMLGPLSNGYSVSSFYDFHPGNFDELANTFQVNNAVKYLSADYSGFTLGGIFGFGGQAGAFADGRNYGFGVQYRNGPLDLSASYASENNRFLELASFVGLSTFMGTPLTANTSIIADNVKNFGIGGSYRLGNVLLRGLYTQTRITYGGLSKNANNIDLGVNWQMTPANALNGGVSVSRFDGGHWITPILTDVYSVSKRTSLYATLLYQTASGSGAVASMLSAGQASGKRQVGVTTGIQHWF